MEVNLRLGKIKRAFKKEVYLYLGQDSIGFEISVKAHSIAHNPDQSK